jgi:glycosyltransferase involved in cell wall biosynthesis
VVRSSGTIDLHLELPRLLEKCAPFDVVIEDLGHVVPFFAERIVHSPGVVFFRHLHRRTLPGQVGVAAGAALQSVERAYPLVFRRWPIVAPSASAMTDLAHLGFANHRLHLIPYGVDSVTFHPGTLSDEPRLIHFSGLRRYKRTDHALRLLERLRNDGIGARLTIVGRGTELAPLQLLTRQLGLESFVNFTGWISEMDVAGLVRQSWLHVQCSTAEGWGLTAWEAAASGIPTVAYRVPGLVDSVEPGISGTLVEDGNISALASAAGDILRHRTEWASRARTTVVGHTWAKAAILWDDLLSQLT